MVGLIYSEVVGALPPASGGCHDTHRLAFLTNDCLCDPIVGKFDVGTLTKAEAPTSRKASDIKTRIVTLFYTHSLCGDKESSPAFSCPVTKEKTRDEEKKQKKQSIKKPYGHSRAILGMMLSKRLFLH